VEQAGETGHAAVGANGKPSETGPTDTEWGKEVVVPMWPVSVHPVV